MPTTFPALDESSRRPTELREERGVSVIYLDGQWLDKESAKVSVFDHGLLYGDGVFEGMRVYNGKTFKLKRTHRPAVRLGPGHHALGSRSAGSR